MPTDLDEVEAIVERRRWGAKEWIMIATLVLNVGALVWGAATMNASVNQLSSTVNKLDGTVVKISNDLTDLKIDYNARISILEYELRNQRK